MKAGTGWAEACDCSGELSRPCVEFDRKEDERLEEVMMGAAARLGSDGWVASLGVVNVEGDSPEVCG